MVLGSCLRYPVKQPALWDHLFLFGCFRNRFSTLFMCHIRWGVMAIGYRSMPSDNYEDCGQLLINNHESKTRHGWFYFYPPLSLVSPSIISPMNTFACMFPMVLIHSKIDRLQSVIFARLDRPCSSGIEVRVDTTRVSLLCLLTSRRCEAWSSDSNQTISLKFTEMGLGHDTNYAHDGCTSQHPNSCRATVGCQEGTLGCHPGWQMTYNDNQQAIS